MSHWTGKYVIGLTGNIGTGKSVVRKMLEHLGAFGIDADGLSHQAMAKGGPAYDQIVQAFGEFVVGADGQIDRQGLGNIVFANPKALAKLEAIIHPIVRQAVDILAKRAGQKVIVVEAIKLLEGDLTGWCDAVWVVNAPEEVQVARLVQKRNMTPDLAKQRIQTQNPQAEKLAKAQVVIQNAGSFEESWTQVQTAWARLVAGGLAQAEEPAPTAMTATPSAPVIQPGVALEVKVRRGKPADAAAIAAFVNQVSKPAKLLTRVDVMEAFGQKAFTLAQVNGALGALAGWRVDNLVTRVDELHIQPNVPLEAVLKPMVESIEASSHELQSEASFIFVSPTSGGLAAFAAAGYEKTEITSLNITAWREAVKETQPAGTIVLFKKLREDRVLRPV